LANAETEIQTINFQTDRNKIFHEKEKNEKTALEPYYLKQNKAFPYVCYSFGITPQQPVIAYESGKSEMLTWFTDRGYLFFAQAKREEKGFKLQYRLSVMPTDSYIRKSKFYAKPEDYSTAKNFQIPRIGDANKYVTDSQNYNKSEVKNLLKGYDTDVFRSLRKAKIDHYPGSIMNDIVFQPAVVQKDMENKESRFMAIVGTSSGDVFAYDSQNAKLYWWQTIGSPVSGRPTVVKDKIYIPGFDRNLTCLNVEDGEIQWQTYGLESFIAASPSKIYARNYSNEFVAVDQESGSQTTLFSLKPYERIYYNHLNDRIYLVTQNGLIQCLHETELNEPVWHVTPSEKYLAYDADRRRQRISPRNDSSDDFTKPSSPDHSSFDSQNEPLFSDDNINVSENHKSNDESDQPEDSATFTPQEEPEGEDWNDGFYLDGF
jgi:hypothetical protein